MQPVVSSSLSYGRSKPAGDAPVAEATKQLKHQKLKLKQKHQKRHR
jgi:hypothetical protein